MHVMTQGRRSIFDQKQNDQTRKTPDG